MREHTCIVCDSPDVESKLVKNYIIIKCLSCGLTYSSPMKSQQDYSQEITHNRWEFYTMVNWLLSKREPFKLKVFEMGCGDGRFLSKLKALGCECHGIDINPSCFVKAKKRGLENIFITTLNENFSKRFAQSFDLIFGFHIIEHIDNLMEVIGRLKSMSKLEGVLCLSVPNPDRLSARIFDESSWDMPPYHLTKWTKRALFLLLQNSGFKVLTFFEEPLTLKSAYIYKVDMAVILLDFILRIRKRKRKKYNGKTNNLNKTRNIRVNRIYKKVIVLISKIISYGLGYALYFSLSLLGSIKILPERMNKGLSLVVVAERKI